MAITANFDGLCEPVNPGGYACWAYVILDENGAVIHHEKGCLGHGFGTTNNIAEYQALIHCLKWLQAGGHRKVVVRGDSKLVVNQVSGAWKVNKPHLQQLCLQARQLAVIVGATLMWVPREQNAVADAYSLEAYKEAAGIEGDVEIERLDHRGKRKSTV